MAPTAAQGISHAEAVELKWQWVGRSRPTGPTGRLNAADVAVTQVSHGAEGLTGL